MFLTVTTTHRPARDLGYLFHKNPDRLHSVKLAFGEAHIFYPEASDTSCTFALALDVDPVALVRGRGRPGGGKGGLMDQYVNDRPYAASSLLCVALARSISNALQGRSKERPDLAALEIPLTATVAPLPCRGEADILERLFQPLGYEVTAERSLLDPEIAAWGESPYVSLTLARTCRLSELLNHLYVLIPVLDNRKHYWVGDDEVDKLLARGAGWLPGHPERDLIAQRYLKYRRSLAREAIARLSLLEDPAGEADPEAKDAEEAVLEKPLRLNDLRMQRVTEVLVENKARRVVDLGCGGGRLLRELLQVRQFEEIVGVDVSAAALERAESRLRVEQMPPRQRERLRLLLGSMCYRDDRLAGFDAIAAVEVIEHLDPFRLESFGQVLFEAARPELVVITTPNREFNAKFEGMPVGSLRHSDHRFEWTRAEFQDWANGICEAYGYRVEIQAIGEVDPELGAPTQMGVFRR